LTPPPPQKLLDVPKALVSNNIVCYVL